MKKPHFDTKRRKFNNRNKKHKIATIEKFDIDKLNQSSDDLIELFKLIQAVRCDRVQLQEQYHQHRSELNDYRMNLEFELIKIKKLYRARINYLQEEYNSVKSNTKIELAKLRKS